MVHESDFRGARRRGSLKVGVIVGMVVLGALVGAILVASLKVGSWWRGPDAVTIASASLQSIREQARLTPFAARFVAVVTSSQTRLGLTAQKTLIMPGTVRYEIDLARIGQRDVLWDKGRKTLTVALPALEVAGPEINLSDIREYGGGGLLSALTDARSRLDESNRAAAQQELLRQARAPLPLKLARDAAKRAVERSFAMPLKAAGIDATVVALFPEERGRDPSLLDSSRSIEAVLNEQAGKGG